jgi:hypothetical protein
VYYDRGVRFRSGQLVRPSGATRVGPTGGTTFARGHLRRSSVHRTGDCRVVIDIDVVRVSYVRRWALVVRSRCGSYRKVGSLLRTA